MEAFDAVVTETTTDNLDNEEVSIINVGKALVAAAISKQGVAASPNNSFAELANKIKTIRTAGGGITFKTKDIDKNTFTINIETTVTTR